MILNTSYLNLIKNNKNNLELVLTIYKYNMSFYKSFTDFLRYKHNFQCSKLENNTIKIRFTIGNLYYIL